MLEERPKNRLGTPTPSDLPSDGPSTGSAPPAVDEQPDAAPVHPPSIHNRSVMARVPVAPQVPAPQEPGVTEAAVAGPSLPVTDPSAGAEPSPAVGATPAGVSTAVVEAAPQRAAPVPWSRPAVDVVAAPSRAGRDLPVAIAVGVGLAIAIVLSLVIDRRAFLAIVLAAVLISVWELTRALRTARVRPPLTPLMLGAVAMIVVTWRSGPGGLAVTTMLTVLAAVVWRLSDGPVGYFRDASTAVLITVYVPLLACFAVLMLRADDGATRIVTFVLVVVCSDVSGYAAGVLFGKHPMSPSVSPKKSWEGFAGSVLACMVAGMLLVGLALEGAWWQGVLYGAGIAVTATLGDLGESIVKRDLGIKDMGTLLPGHGGLMDRMDSLLPSAAVAYLLLTQFVPPVVS